MRPLSKLYLIPRTLVTAAAGLFCIIGLIKLLPFELELHRVHTSAARASSQLSPAREVLPEAASQRTNSRISSTGLTVPQGITVLQGFSNCTSLLRDVQAALENDSPILLRQGVPRLAAEGSRFLHEARANQSFRGFVIISPSNKFELFKNTSKYRALAASSDARTAHPNLPAFEKMPFSEFEQRSGTADRGGLMPLHFADEQYYWQSAPTQPAFDQLMLQPILQCNNWPGELRWDLDNERLRVTKAGSEHELHYDQSNTVLLQLSGQKLVTLIPSARLPYTYPFSESDYRYRRAKIDLDALNFTQYPNARLLAPLTLTLFSGDMLFMRNCTGHRTVALTDVSSLSFRFTLE